MIQGSHLLPAFVIFLEIVMNKVRIPWHHFTISFVITLVYFLIGYISQVLDGDIAVYYTRLNFNCMKDFSYLYNITSHNIRSDGLQPLPCFQRLYNSTALECYPVYSYGCS